LADIEAKGYDPLVLRYFFLQAHYRSKQNFTWEALEAAKIALNNLREKIADLSINKIGKSNIDFQNKFIDSISDDFNMPQVLALIFEVLKSDLLDSDKLATILDFDQVLGLSLKSIKKEKTPKEVVKEVIELQENKDLEDIAENYIIMYEGILCNYLNEVNSFDPKFKRTSIESAYLSALKKTLEPKYSEMMDKESDEVKAYIIWSLIEYAVDNSILAQENFDASRGDK